MIWPEAQWYRLPPQTVTSGAVVVNTVTVRPPARSARRCERCTGRCSLAAMMVSATAPTGRLIRKIQRQDRSSTKTPPSSGPAMTATVAMMPMCAWYFARWRAGMRSPVIACTSGVRPPPPIPCSARKPISAVIDVAVAQSREPARKTTTESWNTRLRP